MLIKSYLSETFMNAGFLPPNTVKSFSSPVVLTLTLFNLLGIFRLRVFIVLCWLFKAGYFVSFWHLLQKGDKSRRGFGDTVCPRKTTLRVCGKSVRGEWSAGASRGVLHTEEGFCGEEDGGIGDGCAKSTGCIKPAKDTMRAGATQQLQHYASVRVC